MKALKDKKKFGWNKMPKNRKCRRFGYQYDSLGRNKDRNALHVLLFRTEGWKDDNAQMKFVVRDIQFFYGIYKKGENLFDYVTRYEPNKCSFWKTSDGRYYNTLCKHIEELYETIRLRENV